jgi:hypothetical protein
VPSLSHARMPIPRDAGAAANTAGAQAFKPLFMAIPPIRSRRDPRRRRPDTARADKAYDSADLRRWLRDRGVVPRIACRGIKSSERLGRHKWKIERTIAWLFGYHRLTVRYERHGHVFTAFITLAATLICYKKRAQITT